MIVHMVDADKVRNGSYSQCCNILGLKQKLQLMLINTEASA